MKKKPNVSITFPNILLIPVLSIVCGIIKLCNGIDWNWFVALVALPIATYFIWCIGYCILAILAITFLKMMKK